MPSPASTPDLSTTDGLAAKDSLSARPASRRTLLAAALGGVGALVASAFGRTVPPARAAAGDPFVIGQANDAGSSQSVMLSSAGGAAFTLKDTADSGTGVFGWSSAATGTGRGLYGRVDAPNGYGVQGRHQGAKGQGAAIHAFGYNNTGLFASTFDPSGYGVIGTASGDFNDAGAGVYGGGPVGVRGSGSRYGVHGSAGSGDGVYGEAPQGHGVHGVSGTSYGLMGESTTGYGVYAISGSNFGVRAYCTGTGTGIWGTTANGWSIYAAGDAYVDNDFQVWGNQYVAGYLDIDGMLTKGGGSFRIDHPLDPERKYLSHSFVESPDMMNIYNGIAVLDHAGEATVEMAAWFHPLNRDFRYQLTPIGGGAPELNVKAELADGRFTIAGGRPGQRVSWQVTGIRQDKWANANRIQVEAKKTGSDVGTYLHPDLYRQPRSKGRAPKHAHVERD